MGNLLGGLRAIGQAQPVSQFINTAGQYQTTQSNLETQRMQQQKMQAEAAQLEKDNRAWSVDAAIAAYPEDHRDIIKNMWSQSGYIQPDNTILGKNVRSTPELYKHYPEMALATNMAEVAKAEKRIKGLSASTDPTAQAELKKTLDELDDLHKKNAFIRGREQQDKGFTLGEGQQRFDAQGNVVAYGQPKEPQPTKTRTIKEGDIERTEEWVDGAWKVIATAPRYKPTTNVITNVNTGSLEKGARAKAQEDVQTGADLIAGLKQMAALAHPEYFTYAGQLRAGASKIGEKTGLAADKGFLGSYTAWKTNTEQQFNLYRKAITGVAAGPQELEMIRKTFPNSDMAESEFRAAVKETGIATWKLMERRRRALAAGIMDEKKQKDFYQLLPLDAMPNPPADFMAQFSGIAGAPKTAEEYFQKKGR